jgi:hypothetical protein
MGGEQAANVLATIQRDNILARGKEWSKEQEDEFKVSSGICSASIHRFHILG